MIPENVTNAVKASLDDASPSEKLVQIRHGESFEDVLKANGASPEDAAAISAAFGVKHGESPVGEGQKIILLPEEPAARGEKPRIARISVYADDQLKATVAITDGGGYKTVTSAPRQGHGSRKPADEENAGGGMSSTRASTRRRSSRACRGRSLTSWRGFSPMMWISSARPGRRFDRGFLLRS